MADRPPPLDARRRTLVRGGILLLAAIGGSAGVYLLATVRPTDDSWYPKCHFHQLTGMHCPGCGVTRALHALFNGQFEQAIAYNLVALVLLPYLLLRLVQGLWLWLWDIRPKYRRPGRFARVMPWVFAGLLLSFWVLRNVPVYPFTMLAPHDLNP